MQSIAGSRLFSALIKVTSALPFFLHYLRPALISRKKKKIFTPVRINSTSAVASFALLKHL